MLSPDEWDTTYDRNKREVMEWFEYVCRNASNFFPLKDVCISLCSILINS